MLRLIARAVCFVLLIGLAGAALAQTEFSADVVDSTSQKHGKGPTKVYFGKDKMRFDSQDSGDPHGGGSVIFDLSNDKWIVLMDKQHMYMEMPETMMENRGMFKFFETGDVENACADWLKLASNKSGTCKKDGRETVNGRNTVKYEGTNDKGEASTVWLDSKLRFPVKWQGQNNGGELQNIKEGSQPSSLFEIPAGYTKFDMNNMMQQQHR
ncbi:MAG TPA: hypothetical protein VMH04_06955 [Candidatus Solibacter sp.]|nr:hypothetical protein [Candidatus Solibacter sp.]